MLEKMPNISPLLALKGQHVATTDVIRGLEGLTCRKLILRSVNRVVRLENALVPWEALLQKGIDQITIEYEWHKQLYLLGWRVEVGIDCRL